MKTVNRRSSVNDEAERLSNSAYVANVRADLLSPKVCFKVNYERTCRPTTRLTYSAGAQKKPPASIHSQRARCEILKLTVAYAFGVLPPPAPTVSGSDVEPSKINCLASPTFFTSTVIVSLPWNSPLSSSSDKGSST